MQIRLGFFSPPPFQGLVLLEFLTRAGSEEVVAATKQQISQIDALTRFHYVDDDGHDHGHNGFFPFTSPLCLFYV